jgi:hypothetical protein
MHRLSRDRFWMRPGYIEEWYLAKWKAWLLQKI